MQICSDYSQWVANVIKKVHKKRKFSESIELQKNNSIRYRYYVEKYNYLHIENNRIRVWEVRESEKRESPTEKKNDNRDHIFVHQSFVRHVHVWIITFATVTFFWLYKKNITKQLDKFLLGMPLAVEDLLFDFLIHISTFSLSSVNIIRVLYLNHYSLQIRVRFQNFMRFRYFNDESTRTFVF